MRRETTTHQYRNLVRSLFLIFLFTLPDFATVVVNNGFQHENVKKESQGHFSAFSYGEQFSAKSKLISYALKNTKFVVL